MNLENKNNCHIASIHFETEFFVTTKQEEKKEKKKPFQKISFI
jgi:hypothetical protein